VFVLEILSGRRVHPVQYLFVGLAMIFFFVLLLSLAEQVGFGRAYLLAASANAAMLSTYIGKVLAERMHGPIMVALMLLLSGLLYLILNLEDYAVLAGPVLGLVALTAIMFATLRVDWSGARGMQATAPAPAE